MPALDQAAPSEDRDRAALQALISAGAPAKDILANPHLRNAGAELEGPFRIQQFGIGRVRQSGAQCEQQNQPAQNHDGGEEITGKAVAPATQ